MEFGMSRRIKPKENYVRVSMKEILAQFIYSIVAMFALRE